MTPEFSHSFLHWLGVFRTCYRLMVRHCRGWTCPSTFIGARGYEEQWVFLPATHHLPLGHVPIPGTSSPTRNVGQYQGAFRAVTWNAQALFCAPSDATRFYEKIGFLRRLLNQADVVLITEAHGTDGGNKAWRPPIGSQSWWTTGPTAGRAGVGVVVRTDFLARFNHPP